MRRRVLANVPDDLKHRELKLGVGGLRDIEFAVQLLQLVHGRSDETLRALSTVEALEALISAGYVGREDGTQLIEAYEFLRLLEHRLQLERFRRTHTLPEKDDEEGMKWLARIAGFVEVGESLEETVRREVMEEVGLHVGRLRYYKSQPWSFSDALLSGDFVGNASI